MPKNTNENDDTTLKREFVEYIEFKIKLSKICGACFAGRLRYPTFTPAPIAQAVAQRKLYFQGDLEQLARRMKYKGIADRVLASIETQFIDER